MRSNDGCTVTAELYILLSSHTHSQKLVTSKREHGVPEVVQAAIYQSVNISIHASTVSLGKHLLLEPQKKTPVGKNSMTDACINVLTSCSLCFLKSQFCLHPSKTCLQDSKIQRSKVQFLSPVIKYNYIGISEQLN